MSGADVKLSIERARQELHAVEINIREGLFAIATSRSYYAMFYAANAVLASTGIARSKHTGVISAFRQYFIKTGLIETEYGDLLGLGFDARQESDYELVPPVNRDLAVKRWNDAQRFVDRIEAYLKTSGTL